MRMTITSVGLVDTAPSTLAVEEILVLTSQTICFLSCTGLFTSMRVKNLVILLSFKPFF